VTIAVLLGAGASVDAGFPTSVEMTDEVIAGVDSASRQRVLEFVRLTLTADLARAWSAPPPVAVDVDVERLFACVEILVDRRDQPWSPFVAKWHPGFEGFGFRQSRSPSFSLENAIKKLGSSYWSERDLADAIRVEIERASGTDVSSCVSEPTAPRP
jgi:hypothetical protein